MKYYYNRSTNGYLCETCELYVGQKATPKVGSYKCTHNCPYCKSYSDNEEWVLCSKRVSNKYYIIPNKTNIPNYKYIHLRQIFIKN